MADRAFCFSLNPMLRFVLQPGWPGPFRSVTPQVTLSLDSIYISRANFPSVQYCPKI
jgi:hypothetical protein